MKTWAEIANERDGLPSPPESYELADSCKFCRHGRNGESMNCPLDSHPDDNGIRKCHLFGCWVDGNGVCGDYKLY